jgi:prepilin-type N-terminal cleavage/methylation domain-containing protein
MKNQKGFSLIELLLVVGVILIISAIAVPSFLRSRMRANEGSAIASIRTIDTAAVTYSVSYPDLGFPTNLTSLGGADPCTASSTTACLIDDTVAQGAKSGYAFVWVGDGATPSVSFTITGTPLAPGSMGQSMYCSDQTGVIHFDPSGAACTNASPALQ